MTALALLANVALTAMLAVACAFDLRSRRIPNRVVVGVALVGLAYAFVTMAPVGAIARAAGGGAVGLALWLPFWLAGVLGAGDVKLAAAAGIWLGAVGAMEAALFSAALGGVLAVVALSRDGGLSVVAARFTVWMFASRTARTIAPELTPHERRLPYGLAISAGAAIAAWAPGLLI